MIFNNKKSTETDIIFIGIDQSMTHTGLTIIINNKIFLSEGFSTTTDLSFEERLISIDNFIINKISQFNPNETSIGIEGLAFNRNKTNNSAMLFGLFSVILINLCKNGYKYSVIPPKTLKKFATGNGNSTKEDLINNIKKEDLDKLKELSRIKNEFGKKFEDISDSYWLAKLKENESK